MDNEKREIDPAVKTKVSAFLANRKANKSTAKKSKSQETVISNQDKPDINQDKSGIEKTLKPDKLQVSDDNQHNSDTLGDTKVNEVIAIDHNGQWIMDEVKEVKSWLEILYNPQKKYDIEEGITYIKNMIPVAVFNEAMKLFTASTQLLPKPI